MYPLANTGGLGDVSAALPAALRDHGADVRVLLPGYPSAIERAAKKGKRVSIGSPAGLGDASLIPARAPDTDVPIWLVDCPPLFDRPGGPYGDAEGVDWPDNAARFALLCHAASIVASVANPLPWEPGLVHANDWQTGLVPAILATRHEGRPPTVFSIHNLAFMGRFPFGIFPTLGLPAHVFHMHGVEFFGDVSFLKAGAYYGDRITTVSPTYAREIQTREFGYGLEGLLAGRTEHLEGILNGVDYGRWNPATDSFIETQFTPEKLDGKAACKAALQKELGLEVAADRLLLGCVTRLTPQKGLDLLLDCLASVIGAKTQLALLGSGDKKLERGFAAAARKYPGRVGVQFGYNEVLSHKIEAGADAFVMPSRYEPCGLNQMYSLKYGTPPIVHRTGGLADTVEDGVTGFTFEKMTPAALAAAIGRAALLHAQPSQWRAMQLRGMALDYSWSRSAHEYLSLYDSLVRK